MQRVMMMLLAATLAASAVAIPAAATKTNPIKVLDKRISRLSAKVGQLTADSKKVSDTAGDFDTRIGRVEQIEASHAAKIQHLDVGNFPNGSVVVVTSTREDGSGGPPMPINGATTETRHVDCPLGTSYISGGFNVEGAAGPPDFGWQILSDTRSGNGHEITILNRNATSIVLRVEAYCIG